MTLKRKASFTTITSPRTTSTYCNPTSPISCLSGDVITMDETPRHLNSRTRKRFKPDRPDEQSIYAKTLRWLFSAQKRLHHQEEPTVPSAPNETALENTPLRSSTPNSNQQTLRRFFQPIQRSLSVPSHMFNDTSTQNFGSQMDAINSMAQVGSSMYDTQSGYMDIDMDITLEIISGIDTKLSAPVSDKRWVGGIGWM